MKLINGDCLEEMKKMESESIDLIVTSPPYDNLRTYNGTNDWSFEVFKNIAQECARVIKKGGVIVWVVGDATIKGSETGTSFKQALYFKDECGLNLHDTMFYFSEKPPLTHNRYEQKIEYMFILSKGKPKTFIPILEECKNAGLKTNKRTFYHTSKQEKPTIGNKNINVKDKKIKGNIWSYTTGGKYKGHPAVFPEKLAEDHIKTWSNEGDIVLDPFMGSNTTGKMALLNNRDFIGIERVDEYFEIAKKRIEENNAQYLQ